jgi:hypothetical protein
MKRSRSAAEEELWAQEVASWDYLKTGNLRGYLSLLHDDVLAWPRDAAAPMNKDAIFQRTLARIALFQSPGFVIELKPLSVRVLGNVGIVQYQADIHVKFSEDERLRFTRTWLRTENGWKLIAGMSAAMAGS